MAIINSSAQHKHNQSVGSTKTSTATEEDKRSLIPSRVVNFRTGVVHFGGRSAEGGLMPIKTALLMWPEIIAAQLSYVPASFKPEVSHLLVMRHLDAIGLHIKQGAAVDYKGPGGGGHYELMRLFDPYGSSGRPSLGNLGRGVPQQESHPQSGKWAYGFMRDKK